MILNKCKRKMAVIGCGGVLLVSLMPNSAEAQKPNNLPKLGVPGGWRFFGAASDTFNDNQVGWQWQTNHNFFNWERSEFKNGRKTWTKFRPQNVQMTGQHLRILNISHNGGIVQDGRRYEYSGGVLKSKVAYLTEGQFQACCKVQWNFAQIWPTFWTDRGDGDELDIMEYQQNILDHAHWEKSAGPGKYRNTKREWAPWMQPKWHHTWAMARVANWTNWAARTTRNTWATFYINGKPEFTSNLSRVDTGMEMLFTSTPHLRDLPNHGSYPDFRTDWVETHIP